jgi:hypothetical protein
VITRAQALPLAKVGLPVNRKTADRIDPSLLQHDHLCPRTHQPIGEHYVARTEDVHQRAQQGQLALPFASVAADSQVNYRSAGQ